MTHVRYLTPFVIFLTLFLISGAGTYYFYNEKMSLQAEIDMINTTQLTQGWVIEDASSLQGDIKLLGPPTGPFHGQDEIGDNVNYTPLPINAGSGYIGAMRSDLMWMRGQYDRLRRFVNAKSQHQLDYMGTSALKPADQLAKAKELHGQLSAAIDTSIRFVMEDTGEAGSGVIADRNTLLQEDRDFFSGVRRALSEQRADIQSNVSKIKGNLDKLEGLVGAGDVRKFEQDQIREQYAAAAKACDRLIYLLSYTRVENKETAIPGLIDSPAKRIAVRLSQHLDPNDLDYLRRPDKAAGSDQAGYINAVLSDPMGAKVRDLSFRPMVQDAYEAPSQRKYRLSNYYLGGITLEEVADNQDMLINMLQHMNHLLADRLMVSLAIYHKNDAQILKEGKPNARGEEWRGTVRANSKNVDDNTAIANQTEGEIRNLADAEQDIADRVQDERFEAEENIRDEHLTFLGEEADKIKADIRKYTASLENLTQIFYRTKTEGIRNDGILKLSGSDGQIVYRDNVDKVYHIDIGLKDHVRKGMRFLVYSDKAGQTDLKALIEITRVPNHNFAICRLVVKFPGQGDIVVGDKVENRLFHNGRFLRVACVGEFRPPNTTISVEQITQYLLELGCEVQDGPDTNTDLVILAQPAENMVPFDDQIRNFLQLRQRDKLDEIQVNDLMIYFEDQ